MKRLPFKDQRSRIAALRDRIRAMHEAGDSRARIAAAVGLDPTSVDYHAKTLGISFAKKERPHA